MTIASCALQSPSFARNTATPPRTLAGGDSDFDAFADSFAPPSPPPCAIGSSRMSRRPASDILGEGNSGSVSSSMTITSSLPASLPPHGSTSSTSPSSPATSIGVDDAATRRGGGARGSGRGIDANGRFGSGGSISSTCTRPRAGVFARVAAGRYVSFARSAVTIDVGVQVEVQVEGEGEVEGEVEVEGDVDPDVAASFASSATGAKIRTSAAARSAFASSSTHASTSGAGLVPRFPFHPARNARTTASTATPPRAASARSAAPFRIINDASACESALASVRSPADSDSVDASAARSPSGVSSEHTRLARCSTAPAATSSAAARARPVDADSTTSDSAASIRPNSSSVMVRYASRRRRAGHHLAAVYFADAYARRVFAVACTSTRTPDDAPSSSSATSPAPANASGLPRNAARRSASVDA